MDYSKIVLLPDELALLRRLSKHPSPGVSPAEEPAASSLVLRWKLVNMEGAGQYSVSRDGRRYLAYCKARRRELWLKNLWIPVIVSFVTTVGTSYILPRLPQILQWASSFLSRTPS